MRLFICCGVIVSQLFGFLATEASNQYFDTPAWPGDEESCPTPRNIQSNRGVYSSPAKSENVGWVGVLAYGGGEDVLAFEKAIFVLTEESSETRGFLSSCIYATSHGRYLSMRLDGGNKHDGIMWITRLSSWKRSKIFSSKTIMECTDKGEHACGFVLK